MTDGSTFVLVAAGLHLAVALLWGVISWDVGAAFSKRELYHRPFRVLLVLTVLIALHYLVWGLVALMPAHFAGEANLLRGIVMAINDAAVVILLAAGRELALLWPVGAEPPGRRWRIVNYGVAAVMATLAAAIDVRGGPTALTIFVFGAYLIPMCALTTRDVVRLARAGSWRPGRLIELSSADAVMIGGGLACIVGLQLVQTAAGSPDVLAVVSGRASPGIILQLVLNTVGGVLIAVPFVVRDIADVLRRFVTVTLMLVAVGTLLLGVRELDQRLADPELRRLVLLGAVAMVVLVLIPAQAWLRTGIDRLVFQRSRQRWAEAHAAIGTLSPDLGVIECCRRALAELGRVLQLRGSAMLLAEGEMVTQGAFSTRASRAAWAQSVHALPPFTIALSRFRTLPPGLVTVLKESDVVAIVPVASPRRRWGHVLITTGLLGATFNDEDDRAIEAVANQFALLLDGAELLARALAVERSLAHAEKLAAIGELAARIAHNIRNPVTAARSLAQQLAREPGSPFAAEHELILGELERVERQVAALLRFSRRDEFRFEPVDLGALVEATLATLQPRLQAADIALETEADAGVVARADGEKLRHVLINLVENSADALSGTNGVRRLAVSLHATNGTATLRVIDSGPGVATATLPHLFEPFFSLKPHGTGLGLAIAKRTIDAHGGRIEAACPAGGGMSVRVDLPLVAAP